MLYLSLWAESLVVWKSIIVSPFFLQNSFFCPGEEHLHMIVMDPPSFAIWLGKPVFPSCSAVEKPLVKIFLQVKAAQS